MKRNLRIPWIALLSVAIMVTLVVGLSTVQALASTYWFTRIEVPGATQTRPTGINNAGQIVGSFEDASGTRGFLRTSSGKFISIEVPGTTETQVSGINNAGQIVGIYAAGPGWHGFLRASNGKLTSFDVPGAGGTLTCGINDAGEIFGYYEDALEDSSGDNKSSPGYHGFLRSPDGSFAYLGLPEEVDPYSGGINNAGQIVGSYQWEFGMHGFLCGRDVDWTGGYDNDGGLTRIDVPDADHTYAYGINNVGEIVGAYIKYPVTYEVIPRGYVRSSDGTFTCIDMPGAYYTYARGINDTGQIVGQYFDSDFSWRAHGFLASFPNPAAISDYIEQLPDGAFKDSPSQRKNALANKLVAVGKMIANGNYDAAIDKLQNEIRAKSDGSLGGNPKDDWIIDPEVQKEICKMIDDLIAYLRTVP